MSRAFEAARHDSSGAVNLDSVRLEVGSLKLVYDFSFTDTAEALLAALLALLADLAPSAPAAAASARSALAAALRRWTPLLDVYLNSESRARDEVELLHRLDLLALADGAFKHAHAWSALLLALSDAAIVPRSALLTWAEEVLEDDDDEGPRPVATEVQRALKGKGSPKSGESGESDGDLFDDTTDGWFGADEDKPSAGKAWWDDDTKDDKEDKSDDEGEKSKNPMAASGSFWANDTFEASDDE